MEEEKTPNPKQGDGGGHKPLNSSNKDQESVFKDPELPVLKLRRRINRIESDQHPNDYGGSMHGKKLGR